MYTFLLVIQLMCSFHIYQSEPLGRKYYRHNFFFFNCEVPKGIKQGVPAIMTDFEKIQGEAAGIWQYQEASGCDAKCPADHPLPSDAAPSLRRHASCLFFKLLGEGFVSTAAFTWVWNMHDKDAHPCPMILDMVERPPS